jgi:hypothetical protein
MGAGYGEHGVDLAVQPTGDPPALAYGGQLACEQGAPLGVGQGANGAAIEVQDVEDDQRGRVRDREAAGGLSVGSAESASEAMEVGSTVGAEANELAVEEDRAAAQSLSQVGEFGELVAARAAGS